MTYLLDLLYNCPSHSMSTVPISQYPRWWDWCFTEATDTFTDLQPSPNRGRSTNRHHQWAYFPSARFRRIPITAVTKSSLSVPSENVWSHCGTVVGYRFCIYLGHLSPFYHLLEDIIKIYNRDTQLEVDFSPTERIEFSTRVTGCEPMILHNAVQTIPTEESSLSLFPVARVLIISTPRSILCLKLF